MNYEQQLLTLIKTILSFIKVNILDEQVLAIHIEDFARTMAKAVALTIVCGQIARELADKLEQWLEPETPDFSIN